MYSINHISQEGEEVDEVEVNDNDNDLQNRRLHMRSSSTQTNCLHKGPEPNFTRSNLTGCPDLCQIKTDPLFYLLYRNQRQ